MVVSSIILSLHRLQKGFFAGFLLATLFFPVFSAMAAEPVGLPATAGSAETEGGSAAEGKAENPAVPRHIQWFHLRLIVGNWGVGGELGAPTLRWKQVYLVTAQAGGSFGWEGIFVYCGPSVGYPLILDEEEKIQLRFGLAPALAWFTFGDDREFAEGNLVGWFGFSLIPEVLFTFEYVVTFSIGFKTAFAVAHMGGDVYPPAPAYFGFIGFGY